MLNPRGEKLSRVASNQAQPLRRAGGYHGRDVFLASDASALMTPSALVVGAGDLASPP
jgi:hypothetical protein